MNSVITRGLDNNKIKKGKVKKIYLLKNEYKRFLKSKKQSPKKD